MKEKIIFSQCFTASLIRFKQNLSKFLKSMHKSKLYELSKSVTKTNNKRDILES